MLKHTHRFYREPPLRVISRIKWLCSCLLITSIRLGLTRSCPLSHPRQVRLIYTQGQISTPAQTNVHITFKKKNKKNKKNRQLKLKEIARLFWWIHLQPVGCRQCETHTHTHTYPTGKTRLANRDGDCSITMVTQMGPRERPASSETKATRELAGRNHLPPLSHCKTWMSVYVLKLWYDTLIFFCIRFLPLIVAATAGL